MHVSMLNVTTVLFSVVHLFRYLRYHLNSSHKQSASASISNNLLDKPHPDVVRSNTENLRVAPVQERLEYAMA